MHEVSAIVALRLELVVPLRHLQDRLVGRVRALPQLTPGLFAGRLSDVSKGLHTLWRNSSPSAAGKQPLALWEDRVELTLGVRELLAQVLCVSARAGATHKILGERHLRSLRF